MTLDDWLSQTKTSVRDFAPRIGKSRVTLYRFLKGERIPNKATMERIYAETAGAVAPADFYGIGGEGGVAA